MLRSISKLQGKKIIAVDGEIGSVDHFFFDDIAWAVRYLVINTGNWLIGRQVLISPYSVQQVDWAEGGISVSLTKEQVKGSPEIDVLRPISRQQEAAFMNYYEYPFYWGNEETWALLQQSQPVRQLDWIPAGTAAATQGISEVPSDSHLRSSQTVSGYHIAAIDGDLGHVEDFVIDDESWTIRYLVISTRNWWPGKKVIIAPQWINSVDWRNSKVQVNLTRDAIKGGPEFTEATLISREYENQLYRHYGHPGYWQD